MRENDQILCNEELLRELGEIEKVITKEMAGKDSDLGIWTDLQVYYSILCC